MGLEEQGESNPLSSSGTETTNMISSRNDNNKNERPRYNNSNKGHNNGRIETEDKSFLGKTKELEAVLGLKTERLTHKVAFDVFREKLGEYILKTFTNARHVITLVEDMENPIPEFRKQNMPRAKRKRDTNNEGGLTEKKSKDRRRNFRS